MLIKKFQGNLDEVLVIFFNVNFLLVKINFLGNMLAQS